MRPGLSCLAVAVCLIGSSAGCSAPPPPSAPVAEAAPPPAPAAAPPPARKLTAEPAVVDLGGGCEGAKEEYMKRCTANPASCRDNGGNEGVIAAYAAVLNEGGFLAPCHTPTNIGVKVCAAVMGGRAEGVTVTTTPGDEELAKCIAREVQAVAFPVYPRLDVTKTTFAAGE